MISFLFSFFGGKLLLIGGLVLACLACLAVIATNWNCRKAPPPPPPRVDGFEVIAAVNGCGLEVRIGLLGRRTMIVGLEDIFAPAEGPLAEESRVNLERLAGKTIRVETPGRRRLFGSTGDTEPAEVTEPEAPPEGGAPLIGVVYGESGACLNVEQLRAGLARLADPDAPRAWRDAEAEAKKAKRGIWGKQAFQPQRHEGTKRGREEVAVFFVPSCLCGKSFALGAFS